MNLSHEVAGTHSVSLSFRRTPPPAPCRAPSASPSFTPPLSLLHDPPYEILSGAMQAYLESPDRYHRILAALFPNDDTPKVGDPEAPPYQLFEEFELDWTRDDVLQPWLLESLRRVHTYEYLDFLAHIYSEWVAEGGSKACVLPETFLRHDLLLEPDSGLRDGAGAIEKAGRFSFDLSCPITADTWVASIASARLALEASRRLLSSPHDPVFALCRPPGHHSTPSLCGGYCFINNAAVVARFLQAESTAPLPPKVAILDVDYHHGNGTSKVFYADPSVLYVSLHGSPDYPYFTGAATERGSGAGIGTNLNFPLPLGTGNEEYLEVLCSATEAIRNWVPQYLVVSLGVDTYIEDPLTDFKMTLEAYPRMGKLIRDVDVPTIFLMEGGYCLASIGQCVRGVLEGFATGAQK